MADRNYIQASPILASYPEYKNTYIYLTFRVKNKYDWNGTGNVYLKYIGRKAGNVPIENNFIWDSSRKWCFHDNTKITPMSNGTIDGQLFGNSNGITLTERLWDSTISDKYFSSDPNSPLYNRYYIFTPPTQGTSVQDEETYIIMRYETDNDGNVITLDTNSTATEMIRLSFEIPTGCDLQTVMLYDVRIHAKSKNESCSSVIYEDVLIDGNNNIKYVDNEVFTITTNVANGNGSITPYEGTKTYVKGSTANYTFVPESGYEVQYAIVDGVTRQGATSQSFINIHENHSIIVYFVKSAAKTYTVSASYSPAVGTIIQPGVQVIKNDTLPDTKQIETGKNYSVAVETNNEYKIQSIETLPYTYYTKSNNNYTFNDITNDTSIDFIIEKLPLPTVYWETTLGGGIKKQTDTTYTTNGSQQLSTVGGSFTFDYASDVNKELKSLKKIVNGVETALSIPNKKGGSQTIYSVREDTTISAVFDEEDDPAWNGTWKLKFKIVVPSNVLNIPFNISGYEYNSNHVIDCNEGVNVKNVLASGIIRKRVKPLQIRDDYDNSLFNLQFLTAGTYMVAFNFIPAGFSIDEIYSNFIKEIYFKASEIHQGNPEYKPSLIFRGSTSLNKFAYVNMTSVPNYQVFDDNLIIHGNGDVSNGVNLDEFDNLIRQIGTDSIYGDKIEVPTFMNKRIKNWNNINTKLEILKGSVFKGAMLPIDTTNSFHNNALLFNKLGRIEGPVFANTSGYNQNTQSVDITVFAAKKASTQFLTYNDVIKSWNAGVQTATAIRPLGIWEGMQGLRCIGLNHSRYQMGCFNGLRMPTDTEITQYNSQYAPSIEQGISPTHYPFINIVSPYFKLLLDNTNIEFDLTVLNAHDYSLITEKTVLYLPNSVYSDSNKVRFNNGWQWYTNIGGSYTWTNWKLILPIETYGTSYRDWYTGV